MKGCWEGQVVGVKSRRGRGGSRGEELVGKGMWSG